MKTLAMIPALALVASCGGGGSNGSAQSQSQPQPQSPPAAPAAASSPPAPPAPSPSPPPSAPSAPSGPAPSPAPPPSPPSAPAPAPGPPPNPSIAPPGPASTPATVASSPYEGIWDSNNPSPALIVDAQGTYWYGDVDWISNASVGTAAVGKLAETLTQISAGTSESHGEDLLTINSALASSDTLTLQGTLEGNCPPEAGGGYLCVYQLEDAPGQWPWSVVLTLLPPSQPVAISALAGSWTTVWGSPLVISTDGTFSLSDVGTLATSDCLYTGQISLLDASQNIYSVSATVNPVNGSCPDTPGDTAQGVFTLLPSGQLTGGLDDARTGSTLDTIPATQGSSQ